MSLKVDLRGNDVLRIGESKIRVVKKSGRMVRLDIEAPPGVLVEHTKALTQNPVLNDYIIADKDVGI